MAGLTHRVVFIVTGLAVMVFLHVVAIICAISRARPSRRVAEHAEEEGRGAGLSPEEVGELPCTEFKEGAAAAGGECAVCLEAFRAGDRCTVVPRCGHVFHAECVGSWLRKSRRCPVCRADVVEQRNKDAAGAVSAADASGEVVTDVLQRV
ncbi:hypothetical protein EJB05_19871, partial [Eragrostis curvula]